MEEIVEKMERLYGAADRIWVMDRGMVSDKNLGMLKQNGRRYIIGTTKASLKRFEQHLTEASDWQVVREGVEAKKRSASAPCLASQGRQDTGAYFRLLSCVRVVEKLRADV